ncbi:MAG: RusA family crossover junction endodeoxyribonuclease [Oscillospiraceae bacterium]|jgi:Holliday junction resolvase RusA-like endonuclease|nr:RusA family crossover junction endodeoxyribonuclease [Oscillospiraceae bacterium]
MRIEFDVPGQPFGKQRPRFAGHAYTPPETVAYEEKIKWAFRAAHGKQFDKGIPLTLQIFAGYPIPKSVSKVRREAMIRDEAMPIVKPDLDNVLKIVADALNKLAYADDAQVCEMYVRKYYAEVPKLHIVIEETEATRGVG